MDRDVSKPRSPDVGRFADRFDWHPEPELIGIRDPDVSREALRAAGVATWETALDYLYVHAFERARGEPVDYEGLRTLYFGPAGRPGAAPAEPKPLAALLD